MSNERIIKANVCLDEVTETKKSKLVKTELRDNFLVYHADDFAYIKNGLTQEETVILYSILSKVKPHDTENVRRYLITADEINDTHNLSITNLFEKLESLAGKMVKFARSYEHHRHTFNWLSSVSAVDDDYNRCVVELPSLLTPFLLNFYDSDGTQTVDFSSDQLADAVKLILSGKHTISIWRLLKPKIKALLAGHVKKQDGVVLDFDLVREVTDRVVNMRSSELRRIVIEPAIKNLNELSDFKVSIAKDASGRIKYRKAAGGSKHTGIYLNFEKVETRNLLEELKAIGIKEEQAAIIIKKKTAEAIEAMIDTTAAASGLNNSMRVQILLGLLN